MTHTSGIPSINVDETDTIAWQPVTKEFMIDHFKGQPLEFTPGSKFSYSNSGYFLLGLIIEKITGKPYEQVVKETIFAPLQMVHSGFDFIHLIDTSKETGYAVYNMDRQRPAHLLDSTVAYAAGAMYTTAGDLYKWSRSIANKQILSPGSWKDAFTPFKSTYGYGWFIDSLNGESYVGHGGGIMGFTSYFMYFPTEDVTLILLSNVFDEKDNVDLPVLDISAIVFGKPFRLYRETSEVTVSDSILKRYIGTYALSTAPKRTIVVTKENGFLQAVLSGKTVLKFVFQAGTKFQFANVPGAEGEFILENEKVTKIKINQNGIFEWNKIK